MLLAMFSETSTGSMYPQKRYQAALGVARDIMFTVELEVSNLKYV